MPAALLITDEPARGERLASVVDPIVSCAVHDLYEDAAPRPADLVIADVSSLTSEAVRRLRSAVACAREDGSFLLFLTHGNGARAEIQAIALGADRTMPAALALRALPEIVGAFRPASADFHREVMGAHEVIADIFTAGRAVTPTLIDTGTQLVCQALREASIRDWLRTVRRFDDATHRHCLLVAGLAAALGNALGLGRSQGHRLTKAALLHDVGKARIPLSILNKPGPLTEAEMGVMRTHPTHGLAMLAGEGFEPEMLTVVRSHHEAIDGSGYPDGLKGAQIPDLVRLVTVCDVYAALVEQRPYRASLPMERAFTILESMTGELDADLVRLFRPIAEAVTTLPRLSE